MALRDEFTGQLKAAMLAGDAPSVSTLRMITAKLKDTDIAARPKGIDKVPDEEILAMLRGMAKSRRESVVLYRQGNRPELAAKEAAEIVIIEEFLPKELDEAGLAALVTATLAELETTLGHKPGMKDMGASMKAVQAKLQATGVRADGKLVSELVKKGLAG